jgi:hypothetical protein
MGRDLMKIVCFFSFFFCFYDCGFIFSLVMNEIMDFSFLFLCLLYFQSQRFAVEYKKVSEKSIARTEIWRRSERNIAVVDQRMESHRFASSERGDGVSAGEFFFIFGI